MPRATLDIDGYPKKFVDSRKEEAGILVRCPFVHRVVRKATCVWIGALLRLIMCRRVSPESVQLGRLGKFDVRPARCAGNLPSPIVAELVWPSQSCQVRLSLYISRFPLREVERVPHIDLRCDLLQHWLRWVLVQVRRDPRTAIRRHY